MRFTLESLPPTIQPSTLATNIDDSTLDFITKFSNFLNDRITLFSYKGERYNCMEMHFQLFGNFPCITGLKNDFMNTWHVTGLHRWGMGKQYTKYPDEKWFIEIVFLEC